ncbi:RagB/SusD family nutrient uptake outer membrane protein [Robertkochia marina]|nr:RagB/SusD family nutrient uptake outer membrane protein [Robertkochia marina]
MKSLKYIAKIACASLLLVACDNELDLAPEDILTQEVAFSNETTTLGVLTGVYSTAQQDDVLNGTNQLMGDWMADNIDFVGSFPTFNEIRLYTTLSDNGSIAAVWDDNYEAIGGANLVIKNAPLVDDPNFTEEEKANVVAQAKFLRALVYYNISNWWAQPLQVAGAGTLSVPLVTEPFEGEVSFPERATLGAVQAQIEQDLLEAIPALADGGDRTIASKGAAEALLARLYLIQERWAEAADYANRVIQNPNYTLASNYDFYNTLDAEHVFTLVNTAADGQDSGQGWSGLTSPVPTGRGDAPYSDNLIATFAEEAGDLRYSELTVIGTDALGAERPFSSKFPEAINNSDNAPVIRITEMYLTRAEANFRGGTSVGDTPVNDINALRARAGLTALGSVDLDQILNERRKELCFEGFRRMDLLRNELNLRRPGMPNEAASAPGQPKTIFPIPVLQRDLNPNMEQNPGY